MKTDFEQLGNADVLIVGGGPAGLSAALELRRLGVARVVVVERDREAGGIPRHCAHLGFGLQDLRRSFTGPRYAQTLVSRVNAVGASILTETSVRSVDAEGRVSLVSPQGISQVTPRQVLLATGARERPRAARLIPGDRPSGIFTTGQLQQWVHLKHFPVGKRALIVGAEHVSFSAMRTLRDAGVATVAAITDLPRQQSLLGATMFSRLLFRAPVMTSTRLIEIRGRGRVQVAIVENEVTGETQKIAVDTVVFTGDWIPESELAYRTGLEMSEDTMGPVVDTYGRTSRSQIFAAGNLVQPAETAGVAALRGRRAAHEMANESQTVDAIATKLKLSGDSSFRWVVPQRVSPSRPPDTVFFRTRTFSKNRVVVVHQGKRELGSYPLRHSTPNRGLSIGGECMKLADPQGEEIMLSLEN